MKDEVNVYLYVRQGAGAYVIIDGKAEFFEYPQALIRRINSFSQGQKRKVVLSPEAAEFLHLGDSKVIVPASGNIGWASGRVLYRINLPPEKIKVS